VKYKQEGINKRNKGFGEINVVKQQMLNLALINGGFPETYSGELLQTAGCDHRKKVYGINKVKNK
jgi:hypothetical protein